MQSIRVYYILRPFCLCVQQIQFCKAIIQQGNGHYEPMCQGGPGLTPMRGPGAYIFPYCVLS